MQWEQGVSASGACGAIMQASRTRPLQKCSIGPILARQLVYNKITFLLFQKVFCFGGELLVKNSGNDYHICNLYQKVHQILLQPKKIF